MGNRILVPRGRHLDPGLGPRFRAFFWGQAISQVGDYVAYVSLPLYVASLSEATFSLGFIYSLETVPAVLFGLLGGVLLDRLPLRSVMLVSDLVRAAAFFALGAHALDPTPPGLSLVFLLAFVIGSFSSIFQNALFAVVPSLVRPQHITLANSRIATSQQFALVVGPALAGILAGPFGLAPGFFLNGVTFLVSAVSVFMMGRVPVRLEADERKSFLTDAWHGLRYLWNEPRLRASTVAAAAANGAVGFLESTLVVLGGDVLGANEAQVGLLYVFLGVGGIGGAVIAPRFIKRYGLGRVLTFGLMLFGTSFFVVLRLSFGWLVLLLFVVMFIGLSLVNVPLFTIRQAYTPPMMLGRVISASRTIGWSTLPVGALIGTAIADSTGYERVAQVAPLLLVITGFGLLFSSIWRDTFGPGQTLARMAKPSSS